MDRRGVATGALVALLVGASPGVMDGGDAGAAVRASVTADPLRLGLAISPTRTGVGGTIKAKGSGTDLGSFAFVDVVVTLRVPRGMLISGSATRDLGPIGAGKTASTGWKLCATVAGNYLLLLTGTATDASGRTWTATSDAAALTVTATSKRCH